MLSEWPRNLGKRRRQVGRHMPVAADDCQDPCELRNWVVCALGR